MDKIFLTYIRVHYYHCASISGNNALHVLIITLYMFENHGINLKVWLIILLIIIKTYIAHKYYNLTKSKNQLYLIKMNNKYSIDGKGYW